MSTLTIADLGLIANRHLANADLLIKCADDKPGHYHAASYLAGYTIEAVLKLAICKALNKTDYEQVVIQDPDDSTKTLKRRVHDADKLFKMLEVAAPPAGMFVEVLTDWLPRNRGTDLVFQWNSERRYEPGWFATEQEAKDFRQAVFDLFILFNKEK